MLNNLFIDTHVLNLTPSTLSLKLLTSRLWSTDYLVISFTDKQLYLPKFDM